MLRRIQKACDLHSLTLSKRAGSSQMGWWDGLDWLVRGKLDWESCMDTRDLHGQDIPIIRRWSIPLYSPVTDLEWVGQEGKEWLKLGCYGAVLTGLCINANTWHFPRVIGKRCVRVGAGTPRRSKERHHHLGLKRTPGLWISCEASRVLDAHSSCFLPPLALCVTSTGELILFHCAVLCGLTSWLLLSNWSKLRKK